MNSKQNQNQSQPQSPPQKVAKIVPCPTCKKSVHWDNSSPYRPFCCQRCKLIDLGDWASENHSIPGDDVPSE